MLNKEKLEQKYGNYTGYEILSHCDHTLLKQDAKWEDIKRICDEGLEGKTASVCIPPSFVKQACEYTQNILPICTVIGFPNGYMTTEAKAFEAANAVKNGACEIDMVINIGLLKEKKSMQKKIGTLSNKIQDEEYSLEVLENEAGSERYNKHLQCKQKAESKREKEQAKLSAILKRLYNEKIPYFNYYSGTFPSVCNGNAGMQCK